MSEVLCLPLEIKEVAETFQVYLSGPMTKEEASKAAVFHQVRRNQVRELYKFYQQNHDQVHTWPPFNETRLNELEETNAPSDIVIDMTNQGSDIHQKADSTYYARIGPATAFDVDAKPSSFNVTGEVRPVNLDPAIFLQEAQQPPKNKEEQLAFIIRASTTPCQDWDPNFFVNSYPWKFPFGRGGFNEQRRVPISESELTAMYIRKSTGAFRGYDIILSLYNTNARKQAAKKTFLRTTANANTAYHASAFGILTEEQLQLAADYYQQRNIAQKKNQPIPRPPTALLTSQMDMKFWTEMEVISKAMVHTKESSDFERLVTYGYHYKFGKATIFLTINPYDCTQILVHFLCGNSSKEMPVLKLRLHQIAQFPGALALYHERIISIITELLIGWDFGTGQPYPDGGVFGHAKAFHGCSEGQDRLSLHSHILIWLYGHDDILQRLQSDPMAASNLEKYIQGVINATHIHPDAQFSNVLDSCPTCKTPFSINDTAFAAAKYVKEQKNHSEPDLLFCSKCDKSTPVYKHIKSVMEKNGTYPTFLLITITIHLLKFHAYYYLSKFPLHLFVNCIFL